MGGKNTKKKIFDKEGYSAAPKGIAKSIGISKRIVDFLPKPEELVFKQSKKKITISLNARSVYFFKQYAKRHNVKYQTMINDVLDIYAQKHTSVRI